MPVDISVQVLSPEDGQSESIAARSRAIASEIIHVIRRGFVRGLIFQNKDAFPLLREGHKWIAFPVGKTLFIDLKVEML